MAEGKIIRLGGGSPVIIEGQEILSGVYQENIDAFETVVFVNGQISKANNILFTTDAKLGYALEDGTTGETKTMMSLFAEPTIEPIVELTTVPTGQLSSPPPGYLRVTITNTTNSIVEVDARLFEQSSPNTLLGVNNLPTTLGPNETFGPSNVATTSGFTQTHILQVRIKEAGKAFSNIAEDIVETVYDPGFTFL